MIKNYRSKRYWFASITFVLCFCLTGALYYYFSKNLPHKLADQLETTGDIAVRNLELALANDLLFVKHLSNYIDSHKDDEKLWKKEAQRLQEINDDISGFAISDASGKITNILPGFIYPLEQYTKEQRVIVQDTAAVNFKIKWLKSKNSGNRLLISTALLSNKLQSRELHTILNIDQDLKNLGQYLGDYSFQLKDNFDKIKYTYNATEVTTVPDNLIYKAGVRPYNGIKTWTMYLFYKYAFIFDNSLKVMNWMLFFGILISLLLALFVFFFLKSLEAVKIAEKSNQELVRTNAKLEGQRQAAQDGSMAKTKFLSNMSHEIRTPLNAILGLCELLKKHDDTEKEHYVHLLQDSSKTLLGLVDDVLAIDRIEAGKEKLEKDTFEPDAILKNLVSFYRSKVEEKNISLHFNIEEAKGHSVVGDRTKFEQISINILSNAIKFTEKGEITINCDEQVVKGSHLALKLVIKDTGIGIPKSKHKKIFNRFTQLDVGLRKKHSGGGLGLSITQKLVELMGGTINVTSIPKQGSTFEVLLEFPLAKSQKTFELGEDDTQFNLDVLAVDDNKLNVVILTKILKNLGMKPDVAYDGAEALEKTADKQYDIIFMDVHMPGMDGFETTKKIRETNKKCLILGLSADATKSAIEEGLSVGMNHYLTKPLDQDKLRKILKKHFLGMENRLSS